MSVYSGRALYFMHAVDPRRVLHSYATIENAKDLLKKFKQTGSKGVATDAEMWEARAIVESCTHPKSGDHIFPLFRMAAFCPVNFAIVPFMLLPSTIASPVRTVMAHWGNQSYNCAVNYANRSSDAMTLSQLMPAYFGAVGVSVSMGLGATFLIRRLPVGSKAALAVRAVLPFAAVSASGAANVAITRAKEWSTEGVDIKDADGNVVGKSTAAGWKGLKLCAAARVIWNIPCMMLPPLITASILTGFPALFTTNARRIALECMACNIGTVFGVPPALAVFPPIVEMPVAELESSVREKLAMERPDLQTVFFFKGL